VTVRLINGRGVCINADPSYSKKFKKGEFLLSEGEVAKYVAFVARGCLYSSVEFVLT
jgi:hypothetical protein